MYDNEEAGVSSNPLSEDVGARLQRLAKRTGGPSRYGRRLTTCGAAQDTVLLMQEASVYEENLKAGFVINRKIVNTATSRSPANCYDL